MRIIAGKYKAKVINSPKTEKTRPTLDRVKEAMFSILIPYTLDANVLDLFSGTGNLGLESISRGAKFAWLNDSSNIAISTIISNVELTNAKTCVKITKRDYIKCLRQIQNQNMYFDIIFLDPPYDSKFAIETLKYISENKNILAKDGIIVYETDKNYMTKLEKKGIKLADEFSNLECIDNRNYGNVVLKFFKWR
ncbi:MAG: 16S rRNA (guanine(966)-N(2))-methyltransferase RsmD [Clostridia bacterium]|nr:16S rRNA (guanine(966)-N(2))-methyltransferase RsmD [Clostridia bacterium]